MDKCNCYSQAPEVEARELKRPGWGHRVASGRGSSQMRLRGSEPHAHARPHCLPSHGNSFCPACSPYCKLSSGRTPGTRDVGSGERGAGRKGKPAPEEHFQHGGPAAAPGSWDSKSPRPPNPPKRATLPHTVVHKSLNAGKWVSKYPSHFTNLEAEDQKTWEGEAQDATLMGQPPKGALSLQVSGPSRLGLLSTLGSAIWAVQLYPQGVSRRRA